MSSPIACDHKESIRWSTSSYSENITFDPVSHCRKHHLTYNESSAKLLSSPAYFTDVCSPDNSCSPLDFRHIGQDKHASPLTVDQFPSVGANGSNKEDDDDDVVIILEKTHMPRVKQITNLSNMCHNDSQPTESNQYIEENANFTDIHLPTSESQTSSFPFPISMMLEQNDLSVPSMDFSREAIPFLDSVSDDDLLNKDNSASFPLTLQNISLDTFNTNSCAANQSLEDDLYNSCSDGEAASRLNFKNFSESLKQDVQDDSSIEMVSDTCPEIEQVPVMKALKKVDVVELSDSDEDCKNIVRQKVGILSRRLSNGERAMPQLVPLCSKFENQDENNNNESAPSPKSGNFEVIDVPSSPEMPKLIPFTSETEEPPKIKTESSIKTESFHSQQFSFRSSLQPKVVLKKLSMDNYKNQKALLEKERPCYIHHIKVPEEMLLPEPDVDVIDGLNFYSFSTKVEMDKYWEKYSHTMPFQVDDDDDNLDSSDFCSRDKNFIIPTKTNDITQIKGWRTKLFAPENVFHLSQTASEDNEDYEEAVNVTEPEVDNSEHSVNDSKELLNEAMDKVNDTLINNMAKVEVKEVIEIKQKLTNGNEDSSDTVKNETKNDICAFVSDALENFLKNKSTLNVSLLQTTNPNITPIPSNASILSIGKLRKADRTMDMRNNLANTKSLSGDRKRSIAPENQDKENVSDAHLVSDGASPAIKIRKKSAGVVASAKVLKRSRQFKSKFETPVAQRLVLRLKKENTGACDGYKVTDISSEVNDSLALQSKTAIPKQKLKTEISIPKEPPVLIKQTLFSNDTKKNEGKLLSEFLTNLNRLGTRNDLTLLVNSNQTYFNVPVITSGIAGTSVSAVTSVKKLIKEQTCKPKKKLHPFSSSSKYKLKNKASFKMKSKITGKSNVLSNPDVRGNQSNIPAGIRGKRSIRLPARFLDSAILAAGSEWVSPVMSFDSETARKVRRNSFQAKELLAESVKSPTSLSKDSSTSKENSASSKDCSSSADSTPSKSSSSSQSSTSSKSKSQRAKSNSSPVAGKSKGNEISPAKNSSKPSRTGVPYKTVISDSDMCSPKIEELVMNTQLESHSVLPSKRITSSPACMCKNTCRVMAYDSFAKRLRCRCIDAILLEAIKTEGLTNEPLDSVAFAKAALKAKRNKTLKSAGCNNDNLHNYAAPVGVTETSISESAPAKVIGDDSFEEGDKKTLPPKSETVLQNESEMASSHTLSSSVENICESQSEHKLNPVPQIVPKELSSSPKPTAIPIPGTNKYVSFVFVSKKSPCKGTATAAVTTVAPSSGVNNLKVSPTKTSGVAKPAVPLVLNSISGHNMTLTPSLVQIPVGLKPHLLVKKLSNSRPAVAGNVYCSAPCTNLNTAGIFTMNNKPIFIAPKPDPKTESKAVNNCMSLNSPVVFALSADKLVSGDASSLNFKSIEVQKDHIFVKPTIKDGFAFIPSNSQVCSSGKPTITEAFSLASGNSQVVLPSKPPVIKEAFSLAPTSNPAASSAVVLPTPPSFYMKSASTASAVSCVNTHTDSSGSIKVPSSKNPQSLKAVKFGDKYLLCPTLSPNKCNPSENIVTIYPAEVPASPSKPNGPMVVTVSKESAVSDIVSLNSGICYPSMKKSLSTDSLHSNSATTLSRETEAHVPSVDKNTPNESSNDCYIIETDAASESTAQSSIEHYSRSSSRQSELTSFAEIPSFNTAAKTHCDMNTDEVVDVETVECSNLQSQFRDLLEKCNSAASSASSSSSDLSSEDDTCDNSTWFNESMCAKLNCTKKSLLERNRRMELRKRLDELRASDPVLESKQSLSEILIEACSLIKDYAAQDLTLSLQVKVLLMRRQSLMNDYKNAMKGINAPREVIREVIQTMKPKHRRFPPRTAITPAVVSQMKMNLKKKIESLSDSECSPASTQSNRTPESLELYALLKCDEKPISSPENGDVKLCVNDNSCQQTSVEMSDNSVQLLPLTDVKPAMKDVSPLGLVHNAKVDGQPGDISSKEGEIQTEPKFTTCAQQNTVPSTSQIHTKTTDSRRTASPHSSSSSSTTVPKSSSLFGQIKSVHDLNSKARLFPVQDRKQNNSAYASQAVFGQRFCLNKKLSSIHLEQRQSNPVSLDCASHHPTDSSTSVTETAISGASLMTKIESLHNTGASSSQEQLSPQISSSKPANSTSNEGEKAVESISKWYSSFGVSVDNSTREKESHKPDSADEEGCHGDEIPCLTPLVIDETACCSKENDPSQDTEIT